MVQTARHLRRLGLGLGVLGAVGLAGCHPAPRISVADSQGTETSGEVVFPVTLKANGSNPPTAHNDVLLFCTTHSGTAGSGADFVAWSGEQCGVIPAGTTTTNVRVQVVQDGPRNGEGNEDFTIDVRPEGAGVVDGTAGGIISDR